MFKNHHFGAKSDPGQNMSGKIFASGYSPLHVMVDSKYLLFLKNRTTGQKTGFRDMKIGIPQGRVVQNHIVNDVIFINQATLI